MKTFLNISGTALWFILVSISICGVVQATIDKVTPDKELPETNHRCVFYNDKGEEIPFHAAQLLVKAEFYRLTLVEIDTLQKYFVLTRHICPYKNCPMSDQVRFNGCGLCKTNSACYALDMIHWENPLWTFDECLEYLKRPI